MSRPPGETHEQVGDRVNDAVRVDAVELRCRVVGEGGNLGFTQLGRIEYALAGGRINTDFIDNSAGVDCSDREVNLKILLGLAEERGDLDRAGRATSWWRRWSATSVARILYDNFLQAQILGQEQATSGARTEAYEDLMVELEADGLLNRRIELLPIDRGHGGAGTGRGGDDRPRAGGAAGVCQARSAQLRARVRPARRPRLRAQAGAVLPRQWWWSGSATSSQGIHCAAS